MISIVVPHYCTNREYFDKCMHSLLKNKEADIEVLIIDDGSPEDYLSRLNDYTSDQRVRVFQEAHKGVSHARNTGIDKAQGEWLMFVDSDDYLEDGYYAVLSTLTRKTDADFIFFNGYGDKHGKQLKNHLFVKENINYGESLDQKCRVMGAGLSLGRTPEYLKCYYTLGAPYSKLINTAFLKSTGLKFEERLKFAEDTVFSLNLIMKATHFYYADVYLYHYFLNEQSVTGKYRKGLSVDMDVFFQEIKDFMNENGLKSQLEEPYYIRAFLEAQRCIRQEFYHRDNPEASKVRHKEAMRFVEKEPYSSGLKADYPYMRMRSCRVASILLRKRQYGMYMKMYTCLNLAKRMAHKL